MSFKQTIGYANIVHPSVAEAKLSFKFAPLGILSSETFYPATFTDSKNQSFRAKRDFIDSYTPEISIETKSGTLNGLSCCVMADRALARLEKAYAKGDISEDHYDYKKILCSWSASVTKFKLVQNQEALANRLVIMVYDHKPSPVTFARLQKSKVLWCVWKDATWHAFQQFRLRVRLGIRSSCLINGHLLESHGGQPE